MKKILINGIEVTHNRLVELTKLADQAKPFYDWVENQFQLTLDNHWDLNSNLQLASLAQLHDSITTCYKPDDNTSLPLLFDGAGRPYRHQKACYYFFAWIIRDAPQQRLSNPIRAMIQRTQKSLVDTQIDVLAQLIFEYRTNVRTFTWDVIREIIIDRLEGSRRSLKGHEHEVIVRTALLEAIQSFYALRGDYGVYKQVEVNAKQIKVNKETYDVSANLIDATGKVQKRILIPVKTRETQGGGHSHLFSRDLNSALNSIAGSDIVIGIIIAKNWSDRELENLQQRIHHLIVLNIAPSEFSSLPEEKQLDLNDFIKRVLMGQV